MSQGTGEKVAAAKPGLSQDPVLICGSVEFCAQARQELQSRREEVRIETANSLDAARRFLETTPVSVILAEESTLSPGGGIRLGRKPALESATRALAVYAPVVMIGAEEGQREVTALLAAGAADYVVRTRSCLPVAIALIERRMRRRSHAESTIEKLKQRLTDGAVQAPEDREFGEILRHELNNPLTGILGNAELLLVELRKQGLAFPAKAEVRLETIAALAVRMRETVRRLSAELEETKSAGNEQ